jgi:hypothetical protein
MRMVFAEVVAIVSTPIVLGFGTYALYRWFVDMFVSKLSEQERCPWER